MTVPIAQHLLHLDVTAETAHVVELPNVCRVCRRRVGRCAPDDRWIFLPAFAFTLLGHDALQRLVHQPRIRVFLDGVTAGVVGLIAGPTLVLLRTSVTRVETAVLFALALGVLCKWKGRLLVPLVICAAALGGIVSTRFTS
jgi:hypothetical protein